MPDACIACAELVERTNLLVALCYALILLNVSLILCTCPRAKSDEPSVGGRTNPDVVV